MNNSFNFWNFPTHNSLPELKSYLKKSEYEEKTIPIESLWKVIPAMPTHYTKDGAIDMGYFEEQIIIMKEKWIKAVLVAWTTGESFSMTHDEQSEYVKKSVNIGKKYQVKILAWTWWNSMIEQESMTKKAFKSWASACLILPPYYIKSNYTGMLEHFASALQHW
jgi:4-hydroxy-tetrahydrodipicolinate synthase